MLACPFLSSNAKAQSTLDVPLKPVFQPGSTYRFVSQTAVRMQMPGQNVREVVIEQQARFDATVRSDGKKGVGLKARTERLNVDLKSGSRALSYDSLNPEDREKALGKHFQASLNRWVDLKLDNAMRIVGSEEGGRAGSATPLPGLPQFGPDELKQLVATIPQGFPEDGKAGEGDEWVLKGSRDIGEVGELTFDIIYRNRGMQTYEDHKCIAIEFSGKMAGDLALGGGGNSAFSNGRMDFQGTGLQGRILFDPLERMIRFSEQTITMGLSVPGKPGEQPTTIPMQQRAVVRLLNVEASR